MDTGRSKSLMSEYPIIVEVNLAGFEPNAGEEQVEEVLRNVTLPDQSPITDQ